MVHRYDLLWKAAIEDFFEDFLRFYFTDAGKIFDFSEPFVFLDKEVKDLFPSEDNRYPKRVDMPIRVAMKNGDFRWVLIHLEVQGYMQEEFAKRMYTYFYRLADRYNTPVSCIALFLGKHNKYNISHYENDFLGTRVRFDFNAYYLSEQDEKELSESKNPFSIIMLTALIALKYKNNSDQLYNLKISLVRNLINSGLDRDKVRRLLNFIKLYIHFGDNQLNINFENQLKLLRNPKEKFMGILELAKEIQLNEAMKKGKILGETQGLRKGAQQTQRTIARKLKKAGCSPKFISQTTGLNIKEIKTL